MKTTLGTTLATMLAVFALASPSHSWPGDDCRFKAERHAEIDTAGVKSIVILAGAGDLKLRGQKTGMKVSAGGKACAPTKALLDQTTITVVREGETVRVSTQFPPEDKPGMSNLWGAAGPYIDLSIDLPAEIPIALTDTSGDMSVAHIAGGSIHDSSGDIEIDDVGGNLEVFDSSGDIRIGDVRGKLTLEYSSGDMKLRNVKGDILVKVDSAGDISITDAGANVTIENDSSGDVDVDGVTGNFLLRNKGSGGVNVHNVRGTVSIPDYKQD